MKQSGTLLTPELVHITVQAEPGETIPEITASVTHILELVDAAGHPQTVTISSVVPVVA